MFGLAVSAPGALAPCEQLMHGSAAGARLGRLMCRSAGGRVGREEIHLTAAVSNGLLCRAVERDAETCVGKHRGSSSPGACRVLLIINREVVNRV